jgi:hypothetical protein
MLIADFAAAYSGEGACRHPRTLDIAHWTGDAGVVDQHIKMPLGPLDDVGRALNRVIRGHVQLNELGAGRVCGSTPTLRVTRTEIHAMPRANKSTYRLQTDSLVGSSDQGHRAVSQRCGHDHVGGERASGQQLPSGEASELARSSGDGVGGHRHPRVVKAVA